MRSTSASILVLLFLGACGPGSTSVVPLESWCVELESALRDRHVACACAGETLTDEAILARCETLDARSLDAAIERGELLWNGTIASAILRSARDDCERAELRDDPVIGNVEIGGECRVFEDVASSPDDCVRGARCAAPLGGGAAVCVERGCMATSECADGAACVDGECTTPVCADSGG